MILNFLNSTNYTEEPLISDVFKNNKIQWGVNKFFA